MKKKGMQKGMRIKKNREKDFEAKMKKKQEEDKKKRKEDLLKKQKELLIKAGITI